MPSSGHDASICSTCDVSKAANGDISAIEMFNREEDEREEFIFGRFKQETLITRAWQKCGVMARLLMREKLTMVKEVVRLEKGTTKTCP
jgi:hypothetical protein